MNLFEFPHRNLPIYGVIGAFIIIFLVEYIGLPTYFILLFPIFMFGPIWLMSARQVQVKLTDNQLVIIDIQTGNPILASEIRELKAIETQTILNRTFLLIQDRKTWLGYMFFAKSKKQRQELRSLVLEAKRIKNGPFNK